MESIRKNDLNSLLTLREGPCVSMYLTASPKLDSPERLAAFRSELKRAQFLLATQYRTAQVEAVLDHLRNTFLHASRARPHSHLALFSSPKFSGYLHHSLTGTVRTVVANSFHVRPLLPWMDSTGLATALVARRGELQEWRLFPGEPELVTVHEVRGGIADLAALLETLRPKGNAPLVVAANSPHTVDFVRHLFRHPTVLALAADGPLTVEQWLPKAEDFVQRWRLQREHRTLDEYLLHMDTPRSCSSLPLMAQTLRQRRAEVMLVNRSAFLWNSTGRHLEGMSMSAAQRNGQDDDLVDDLVEEALRRRIPVVEVDYMPRARPVAVILRGGSARRPIGSAKERHPEL